MSDNETDISLWSVKLFAKSSLRVIPCQVKRTDALNIVAGEASTPVSSASKSICDDFGDISHNCITAQGIIV